MSKPVCLYCGGELVECVEDRGGYMSSHRCDGLCNSYWHGVPEYIEGGEQDDA